MADIKRRPKKVEGMDDNWQKGAQPRKIKSSKAR